MRSGKGDIAGQITRIADGAAYEQPAFPARLGWVTQLQPQPVVGAWAFTTCACAQTLPAYTRQSTQNGFDLLLLLIYPHPFLSRDRQDIGLRTLFQPATQYAIVAIDTIPTHKRQHHTTLEGTREHLLCQRRFGGKGALVRDTGATTALAIVDPFFWQIQLAIKQRVALRRGVGQKDADLAVLNPPGGTTILACHASGMATFLEKASLINHSHSISIGQIVGHIAAQFVAQQIGIPVRAPKQVLKAIRIGVAANLSQLP